MSGDIAAGRPSVAQEYAAFKIEQRGIDLIPDSERKMRPSGFAGMIAALMWINAAYDFPAYVGPISNHFPGLHGGDFSWAIGIVVGAGIYWALAGRRVRQEAAQTAAA